MANFVKHVVHVPIVALLKLVVNYELHPFHLKLLLKKIVHVQNLALLKLKLVVNYDILPFHLNLLMKKILHEPIVAIPKLAAFTLQL